MLFLDELPEFKRTVLETLRQPMEEGRVTISRAVGSFTFPAQFMLVAAMNPAPDGRMPHESQCSPRQIQAYLARVSGPLLDRIDLHIEVPPVKFQDLASVGGGEPSGAIRGRVIGARERQLARFRGVGGIRCNARMESRDVRRHCVLDAAILEYLKHAMQDLGLSARAYDRVLKVSRTIADLAGSDGLAAEHVMEAVQLRSLDRQIWG